MNAEFSTDAERLHGGADTALNVVDDAGGTLASCSLWSTGPVGILGHFHATSAEASATLFEAVETHFRKCGYRSMVGPMDGNTWQSYRLVTRSDGRPPFFLEPRNPPDWPAWFEAAGWTSAADYTSSEISLVVTPNSDAIDRVSRRLESTGVTIRPLKPDHFEAELRKIHEVSLISFRGNFLYSPIGFDDFKAMYLKIQSLVAPEFSLLAEDAHGHAVGFVFALPEPADPSGSLIVKTLAVLPERRLAGLGSLLIERVHQAARTMGFDHAIHALQHQSNSSLKISARHDAKVFRHYTLFEKALSQPQTTDAEYL